MNRPIHISEKARSEIKNIMENKKIPEGYCLRVGVKGGGCGASFVLGFDKEREGDNSYIINEIPVLIQKKEMMFLIGKEVGFYEGADARGFMFADAGKPGGH